VSVASSRAGGYMARQWTVTWSWGDDDYPLEIVAGPEMGELGHKIVYQTVADSSTPITGNIEV